MIDPAKLLLVGPKGVGKSTAIAAVANRVPSQRAASLGIEVAAPLAIGEVHLADGRAARLYGVPEQDFADYRLEILARDAHGLVFLIDQRDANALAQLNDYLDRFSFHLQHCPAVVAVTHSEAVAGKPLARYHALLAERELNYPVFPIDAREPDDVLLLVQALLASR